MAALMVTAPVACLHSRVQAFSGARRSSNLTAGSSRLTSSTPLRMAGSSARQLHIVAQAAAAEVEAAPAPVDVAEAPEAVAHLRYLRMQPSKVRRVLDTIRGRTYEEALMILEYMPYRACDPILKCLVSAAANAKQNQGMRKAKLVVTECYCNEGPVLKRFQPRAQGRAYQILKSLCHITIKVKEQDS